MGNDSVVGMMDVNGSNGMIVHDNLFDLRNDALQNYCVLSGVNSIGTERRDTLPELIYPLTRRFLPATNASDLGPDARFADSPNAFGVVYSYPVFIQRPQFKQAHYYFGKYKAHCMKMQPLITADGERVHLSPVYCDSTHDKAMFDNSQVVRFLTTITDDIPERKLILVDLGYMGIRRTIPEATLPYTRLPHQELSPEQVEFNRILGRNRMLIENFVGRWNGLFRIIHGEFGGSRVLLTFIIPITIVLVNYHIIPCEESHCKDLG
jgi:hypothetical protein